MDKFSIILPNEKQGTYKILTLLIAVINLIGFLYFSMQVADNSNEHTLSFIGAAMVAGPLGLYLILKKGRPNNLYQIVFSLFAASVFWMLIGFYWMGFLLFLFALLGLFTLRKLKVDIDDHSIVYPSVPRKKIEWKEVSNLILKDNILTIDLKNNILMQHNIDVKQNEGLDEFTFNTFVQRKLNNINNP